MENLKELLFKHFKTIVFFMEVSGENPFKIKAFRNLEENLEGLDSTELEKEINTGQLTERKGIGKGVLSVCQEFLKTGSSAELIEQQKKYPPSLLELSQVRGLGPKKIRQLFEDLQISSLSELEYACVENRLVDLKGFGEKTQNKILEEIQSLKSRRGKLLLCDALPLIKTLKDKIAENYLCNEVGDLGAKREIVNRLELLVSSEARKKDPEKTNLFKILGKPIQDSSEVIFKHKSGADVAIRFTPLTRFGVESVWRTSSKAHQDSLVERAKAEGFELHAEGLFQNSTLVPCLRESDLYAKLKLPFHPPEAREWKALQKEIEWIEEKDLKGVFHAHSTYSDGTHSLTEMAEAAQKKGWAYLGISEHSKTAFYASGLEESSLQKQWKEIEDWNKKNSLQILKGIESDILKDGSLDYENSVLEDFDFVIGSIHQRYGAKEMTDRLIRAIENPYLSMLGHVSGRLLLGREPYAFDKQKVIRAAIQNRVIIELNANPHRMDMDWRDLKEACEAGLMTSINPDAHSISGFEDIQFGLWMARKALIKPNQIFNTWPLEKIQSYLADKKSKKAS